MIGLVLGSVWSYATGKGDIEISYGSVFDSMVH
jgi:hypothetical protein